MAEPRSAVMIVAEAWWKDRMEYCRGAPFAS